MQTILYWHWWAAGLGMIVLEMFAPGTIFLWMGVSAGLVGFVLLAFPDVSLQIQLLVFAVLAVATVLSWRAWQKRHPASTDEPALNRRGEQYIGQVATLTEPIVNGTGKVHLSDTYWKIEGADLPAGTKIRIVGVSGSVLKVERA